jgi:hypothetical protein
MSRASFVRGPKVGFLASKSVHPKSHRMRRFQMDSQSLGGRLPSNFDKAVYPKLKSSPTSKISPRESVILEASKPRALLTTPQLYPLTLRALNTPKKTIAQAHSTLTFRPSTTNPRVKYTVIPNHPLIVSLPSLKWNLYLFWIRNFHF